MAGMKGWVICLNTGKACGCIAGEAVVRCCAIEM